MAKNKIMILMVTFIFIIIVSLYGTFAMVTQQTNEIENIDYAFVIGKTTNKKIIISSNTTKTFDIMINNPYEGALNYGITYKVENDYEINIGVLNNSKDDSIGTIEENSSKNISLIINNPTENDITINISIVTGYINGGELIIEKDEQLITKIIDINSILDTNLDESGANMPKITDGMIPIYFDKKDKMWHKADKNNSNTNYQWYDYNNKMWANVVLIDEKKIEDYQKLKVGEIIEEEDIIGYLVWIPRFKYKVWDIQNTQNEENYYYNPKNDGINIIFETSTNTTGEISCKENDNCVGENGKYYTHPAFNFNNSELAGFWVGKFETTGTKEKPTILPNYSALTFLDISEEIESSSLLTKTSLYNLNNSKFDSHVIKDLEWSAISYLANSIYGMCNGAKNGCRSIYPNKSIYYNTGTSNGTEMEPNNFGIYSYLGERLDEYGIATEIIDETKISSTTGNVYGVYDMVGGADETVMLTNNKESDYLKSVEKQYYTLITEKPILGQLPYEINQNTLTEETWFTRGGNSTVEDHNIYRMNTYDGNSQEHVSFRICIS